MGDAGEKCEIEDGLRAFLAEELKARRSAIERLSDAIDRDAQVAVVASVAFWSWFASHTDDMAKFRAPTVILLLPALLAIIFLVRWFLLQSWIRTQAAYVRSVETAMSLPQGLGWEHFLAPSESTSRIPRFPWFHVAFWSLLLLVNICFATWATGGAAADGRECPSGCKKAAVPSGSE